MEKEYLGILHLPIYRLSKLFREQTFIENMKIIKEAHECDLDLYKTLMCTQICVIQLLCDNGMSSEAAEYVELMKEILWRVENGNYGNKRTVSGDVSGTHE